MVETTSIECPVCGKSTDNYWTQLDSDGTIKKYEHSKWQFPDLNPTAPLICTEYIPAPPNQRV